MEKREKRKSLNTGVSEEVRLLEHMVLSEFPGKASYLDLRDDFHVRVWQQSRFRASQESNRSQICL